MKLHKILFMAVCLFFTGTQVYSQDHADSVDVVRDASNLSSGNTRDVLVSFLQVAFQDLSSDKKEFLFSSNVFALKLLHDTALNIDKNYVKNYFARNSNITLGLKLDSSLHFDGVRLGYKYALINKRDYAVSRAFAAANIQAAKSLFEAQRQITREIGVNRPLLSEMDNFFQGQIKYKDLSKVAKEIVDRHFNYVSDNWSPDQDLNRIYEDAKASYKKKFLWTVATNFNSDYGDTEHGSFNLETQVLQGIKGFGERLNVEFDGKAQYVMSYDSLKEKSNMKRRIITTNVGINLVLRNKYKESFLEAMIGTGYNVTLSDLYEDENKTRFLLTSTIRFRIFEIWIPVDLKYDPKNANWFGTLSVKANFDGLRNIFGAN